MLDLPRAFGEPVCSARIRSIPEDFFVEELPAFDASGEGEHLLLTIEKRGMNTAFVAEQVARWACVAEVAVGYAGMKDRHAVTRQRFSVQLPGRESPDIAALESDALRVLSATRHARKLQRGALRGNRFVLILRDVVGDRGAVERRLTDIATHGFPNYFGEQRFGHGGGNLDAARRMFAGQRVSRYKRGLLLSAARSELFNMVLGARVADGSWRRGLPGELWMLDGSRSIFGPESDPDSFAERVAARDIHPTGPLWGRGTLRTADACRTLEESVLASLGTVRAGLESAGLNQERRSLRTIAGILAWEWQGVDVLRLQFELAPGSYATSLLRSIGDIADASAGGLPGTTNGMLHPVQNGVD